MFKLSCIASKCINLNVVAMLQNTTLNKKSEKNDAWKTKQKNNGTPEIDKQSSNKCLKVKKCWEKTKT